MATPMFTVPVSCCGKLAVHSCPLFCLQGQVRVARLAFLGQISGIWPRSKLVGLKGFCSAFWSHNSFLASLLWKILLCRKVLLFHCFRQHICNTFFI